MKLLFCFLAALITFAAETKAATTQYHYEGNAFTDISVTDCCGLRFVGDIMFNFDTTGVSGTFGPIDGSVSFISFGVVDTLLPQAPSRSMPGPFPWCYTNTQCQAQSFTINDAVIVAWQIISVPFGSDWNFGQYSYFQQNHGEDGNNLFDPACNPGRPCGTRFYSRNSDLPGTWTTVPVPAPFVGAGLPGLLIAIAGFIGWSARKRSP